MAFRFAVLILLLAALPAQAAPVVSPVGNVVAILNGDYITEDDLAYFAETATAYELEQLQEASARKVMVMACVGQKLFAQAAARLGIYRSDEFAESRRWLADLARASRLAGIDDQLVPAGRFRFLADRALQNALLKRDVDSQVTDEAVAAEYQQRIAAIPDEFEFHIFQIVTASEAGAREVRRLLAAGGDFDDLVADWSIDPPYFSERGDLGFRTIVSLPEPYSPVLEALPDNVYSEVFQTYYGWAVIRIDDRRLIPKPPIDELRAEITNDLRNRGIRKLGQRELLGADLVLEDESLRDLIDAYFR